MTDEAWKSTSPPPNVEGLMRAMSNTEWTEAPFLVGRATLDRLRELVAANPDHPERYSLETIEEWLQDGRAFVVEPWGEEE